MAGLGCSETSRCTVCQKQGSLLDLLKSEDDDRVAGRRDHLKKVIPPQLPRWEHLSAEEQEAAPKPDQHRDTSTADWRRLVKGWLVGVVAGRQARMNPRKWLDGDCGPAEKLPLQAGVYKSGSNEMLGIAVDYVSDGPDGCTVALRVKEVDKRESRLVACQLMSGILWIWGGWGQPAMCQPCSGEVAGVPDDLASGTQTECHRRVPE